MTTDPDDKTSEFATRVAHHAQQLGLTIDADAAARELIRTKFFASKYSPQIGSDEEVRQALLNLTGSKSKSDRADTESRVHPANAGALAAGVSARMLAQLGSLDFQALPAIRRMQLDANFRTHGHVNGPVAAAKAGVNAPAPKPAAKYGTESLDNVVLPPAAQKLSGMARLEAARNVAAANVARDQLTLLTKAGQSGTETARKLREVIVRGWGGSP